MNKTKVLVTGSGGFIGKNLLARLQYLDKYEVFPFDKDTDKVLLRKYCKECDIVVHLAGVNRPIDPEDFQKGNVGFTEELLSELEKSKSKSPIIVSSSTQAALDNDYGRSKKGGEDLVFAHAKKRKTKAYVFRFTNVFGKWCRPNYNSAVATFCANIANGLPVTVSDPDKELALVYIDDVIDAVIDAMNGKVKIVDGFCDVEIKHKVKLGALVDLIKSFSESRNNLFLPAQERGSFEKKLYSMYTSYIPKDKLNYELKMNVDDRGSFTEFLKIKDFGQVSINIAKSGVCKGNHWHHSKNEKFLAVSGSGVVRIWELGKKDEAIEYKVSGEKFEVIDMPCGSVHSIENKGGVDLVTIIWANEIFDKEKSDTYFEN